MDGMGFEGKSPPGDEAWWDRFSLLAGCCLGLGIMGGDGDEAWVFDCRHSDEQMEAVGRAVEDFLEGAVGGGYHAGQN